MRTRAFTLLELILVLAVVALMMGVAAAALMRSESGPVKARRGLAEVVMHLRAARADAMVTRSPVAVELVDDPNEADAGRMLTRRVDDDKRRAREVDLGGVGALDPHGGWATAAQGVRVRFDASGRSDARGWRFAERSGERAGRIVWVIVFDPVSGDARLTEGDGSIAGQEQWGERAAIETRDREQQR